MLAVNGVNFNVATFKANIPTITQNEFERNYLKSIAALFKSVNATISLIKISRSPLSVLTRARVIVAGNPAAIQYIDFRIASKQYLILMDQPMSLESVVQFIEIQDALRPVDYYSALIKNADVYCKLFSIHRCPFKPRLLTTFAHYCLKYKLQAHLGYGIVPKYEQNMTYLFQLINNGMDRDYLFCLYGNAWISVAVTPQCFAQLREALGKDLVMRQKPFLSAQILHQSPIFANENLEDLICLLHFIEEAKHFPIKFPPHVDVTRLANLFKFIALFLAL